MVLFVFGRHPFHSTPFSHPKKKGSKVKNFLRHLGRCVNTFKVRKVPQTVYELHENRSVSRFYRITLNEQSNIVITDLHFALQIFSLHKNSPKSPKKASAETQDDHHGIVRQFLPAVSKFFCINLNSNSLNTI